MYRFRDSRASSVDFINNSFETFKPNLMKNKRLFGIETIYVL